MMTAIEMYDVWYSEYPRHEARIDGKKAFLKLNPTEELFSVILEHVRLRKKTQWLGKDKQHIPLPASFIRGERWTDEIEEGYGQQRESAAEAKDRRRAESAQRVERLFDGPGSGIPGRTD